jgi:hypothetical protein
MIVKPGLVIDFLRGNHKVDHPDRIDRQKVSCIFGALDNIAGKVTQPYMFLIILICSRNRLSMLSRTGVSYSLMAI